jgi:hypothetical protein
MGYVSYYLEEGVMILMFIGWKIEEWKHSLCEF